MSNDFDVLEEYKSKIQLANNLLDSLSKIENKVKGTNKFKTKIKQELTFLQKVYNLGSIKKEHLVCSNLNHFEAFISKILNDPHCVSVLEVFHFKDEEGEKSKICVDIVSHSNTKWTKVVARNPKALSQISKGEGEYQRKSIVDHAIEFLTCASQNSVLFKPPKVEFHFACGVDYELAEELSELGVYISGNVINELDSLENDLVKKISPDLEFEREIVKLNLDVTAMIAYVSALTNGNAFKQVKGKVLSEQAEWERQSPVKPVLDKLFEGKELFICETVKNTFESIVHTIGGPGEKERSKNLLERVKVVPDVCCDSLTPFGQIKQRSLIIFGTGQAIKAITVTANSAFVRAAENQGVHFDVFFHEPRALTEKKELP